VQQRCPRILVTQLLVNVAGLLNLGATLCLRACDSCAHIIRVQRKQQADLLASQELLLLHHNCFVHPNMRIAVRTSASATHAVASCVMVASSSMAAIACSGWWTWGRMARQTFNSTPPHTSCSTHFDSLFRLVRPVHLQVGLHA
jgi:hypothetical protein